MAPTPPSRTASLPVYKSSRPGYYVNSAEQGQWAPAQEVYNGRYSTPPSRPYSGTSTPQYSSDYSARAQQLQHQQQLQQLLRIQHQQQQQLLQQQERTKIPTPPMSLSPRAASPPPARSRAPSGDEYIRQIMASKIKPSMSKTSKSPESLKYLDFQMQILDFLPFRGQAYQNVNECLKKGASLEVLLREAKLGYERAPVKSDEEEFYLITMEDVERRIAAGQRGFSSTRR